jgi:pilus assembly protein Flp/PilA
VENPLQSQLRDLILKLQSLAREDGQDMVEYALLVALIAFAATSGTHTLANDINSAFSAIGSKLTATV